MTAPMPPPPIFVQHGSAAVSYLPGHEVAEVEMAVRGQRLDCNADEARQLVEALFQALTSPEVVAILVARRAGVPPEEAMGT